MFKICAHTFNSYVSTHTYPGINKEIHMLIMHGTGTLNTFVPGHYILRQLIRYHSYIRCWPWKMNIYENVQTPAPYFS